jgi:hypothetical protein
MYDSKLIKNIPKPFETTNTPAKEWRIWRGHGKKEKKAAQPATSGNNP